jgi:glycerol-3-phosphate acyltransferase PlsY
VLALLFGDGRLALMALALAAFVIYRHEANIRRLLDGTEPRIGKGP